MACPGRIAYRLCTVARLVLLGAFSVLLPAFAAAAEFEGRARVSVGAGVDSNARRDYDQAQPVADGLLSAHGAVDGRVSFPRAQLLGAYDLGGRRFFQYASEDVLVQVGSAEASMAVGRYLGLGVLGRGRDRRGGARDYTDLSGVAFVDLVPDAQVELRAHGGGHRFIYWPVFPYSFSARELGGTARYRFNRSHSVSAFGELGLRRYNGQARPAPDLEEPPPLRQRRDNVFGVGAGYAYRGPFAFSATWGYTDQSSNSFGETSRRHRLTLSAAVRLPWRLFLMSQLNLQLASYPDGVFLSPEIILDEDAENHNALSLKLARPVTAHFDVEVRYALFQNRLAGNDLHYFRQLVWLGFTWRY
jgi:hypothetical protein